MSAPKYELIKDFSDDGVIATSPAVVLLVVRLGKPLSYSRKNRKSVTNDVSEGARLRGPSLIIVSDCHGMSVAGSKDSHLKTLTAELKQSDHNYLVEILSGDWVLAWMVDYRSEVPKLINKIKNEEACNDVHSGFKFVGRVESIRKRVHVDHDTGMRTVSCTLGAIGLKELDSSFFYSPYLAQADESINMWLARINQDMAQLFEVDQKTGRQKNNSSKLIKMMIQIMLGKGIDSASTNPASKQLASEGNDDGRALSASAGAGTLPGGKNAPYAYLVPKVVGKLLGVEKSKEASRGAVISYADLLESVIGVQQYENKDAEDLGVRFAPTVDTELLGTYLPLNPNFANTPLWSSLQQFLNPHINEMYTALRLNKNGRIVPTIIARQMPSTDAWTDRDYEQTPVTREEILVTKHHDLPRWILSPAMIEDIDVGRSDATHFNFVHIVGQDANQKQGGENIASQIVQNPPIRDDLDIMRHGLRPYMATVACAVADTIGTSPGPWIELVADRIIGSHHTLNGTIVSLGIQAPIAEGDALEFDGVVYEIQSVAHRFVQNADGKNVWTTTLTLTNGYRAEGSTSDTDEKFPIYPGFKADDNTAYEPGFVVEDQYDRTPPEVGDGDLVDDSGNAADFASSGTKNSLASGAFSVQSYSPDDNGK